MSPFPSWIFATLLDKSSRRAHTCGIVILNFPGLAQQLSCSDALMADTCVIRAILILQSTSNSGHPQRLGALSSLQGHGRPVQAPQNPTCATVVSYVSWVARPVEVLWHICDMPCLSVIAKLSTRRLPFQSHSQCLYITCPLYICPARVSNQSSRSNITAWFCAKQQLSEPRIPQQISGSVIAVTGAASLGHWLSQAFWYDQTSINVATWPNEVVSKEKRDCHLWPDK